jgi:hypothetical protein
MGASVQWKIVLEGVDEFGSAHRSEFVIEKDIERLASGEIGFSIEDGKAIMALSPAGGRQAAMRCLRPDKSILHGLQQFTSDQGLQQTQDSNRVWLR